jgi:hypothetical protein
MGGDFLKSVRKRRPHQSCCELAGARSLLLAQRIIIGFAQALDFAAVEALIPDLKPCAEGFGCTQVFDGVTAGLKVTVTVKADDALSAQRILQSKSARSLSGSTS